MAKTNIVDLLSGLFLTVVLILVLILLLKVVKRVSVVGLENNELEMEDEGGSINEDKGGESNDKGEAEDKTEEKDLQVDDNSSATQEEDENRDDFWEGEDFSPYKLSCAARYVKTETKHLQLSLDSKSYLYKPEGEDYITVKITDDPSTVHGTTFKLHYFDLRNFPRDGSYIIIESEGKFIQNVTHLVTDHYSVLLRLGTPPSETVFTDDRFFGIQSKLNDKNKVHFQHLNSGLYLATKGGYTRTVAELFYAPGEPPERATFVPLDCERS